MQLYYIRHAQSTNNALYASNGSLAGRRDDPELTEIGVQQAKILADFLRQNSTSEQINSNDLQNVSGFRITHLYTSLMVRAAATGAWIARELGLPLHGWVDLHEWGGIYLEDEISGEKIGQSGRGRSFFQKHFPELVLPSGVSESGWWNRAPERKEEFRPRGQRVLETLLSRHGNRDDNVVFVSHGGFFNVFVWTLLGLPEENPFWFELNNASISRFDFAEGKVRLVYLNRIDFMPRELIT
jgi:2,3-bisphosphoglycerate-dependent phosphoglycerate mutase